jgi:hypothetical protein
MTSAGFIAASRRNDNATGDAVPTNGKITVKLTLSADVTVDDEIT